MNFAFFAPLGPLSADQKLTAAAGISAFLLLLLIWLIRGRIIKTLRAQLAQAEAAHAAEKAALQAKLAVQTSDFQQRLHESISSQVVLEQRFATHREASFRRETDARARIATLEAELRPSRELAAQLPPTQARIGDLEGALGAERGRIGALEQAVAATARRADDLEGRLRDTEQSLSAQREQAAQREAELTQQLAANERTLAGDLLRLASADSEIIKLKEAHEAYRQQAETRLSNLQRGLPATEARPALVHHEAPDNGALAATQSL
ncbi:MAG: hypothetical protein U0984_16490 [Prosthecobacter sp.]|nr:hypothetical protein [Prosthecobacter sp.]